MLGLDEDEVAVDVKRIGLMDRHVGDCALTPLDSEVVDGQANSNEKVRARVFVHEKSGWVRANAVMDSGCNESVAPPGMCPDYEIKDCPGSRRGQHYI